MFYNPANWYWLITGQSDLWSSASASFVPTNDAAYEAWLVAGNAATKIASGSEIYDVLAAQAPTGIGPALAALADPQQQYIFALGAGLAITSQGTPAASGVYGIETPDLTAMMAMQLAVEAGKPLPAAYWDTKGNHGSLTGTLVTNIADAIFTYEAALVAWVDGGGSGSPPAAAVMIA